MTQYFIDGGLKSADVYICSKWIYENFMSQNVIK